MFGRGRNKQIAHEKPTDSAVILLGKELHHESLQKATHDEQIRTSTKTQSMRNAILGQLAHHFRRDLIYAGKYGLMLEIRLHAPTAFQ